MRTFNLAPLALVAVFSTLAETSSLLVVPEDCTPPAPAHPTRVSTYYPDFATLSIPVPQITLPLTAPSGYALNGNVTTRSAPSRASKIAVCTVIPHGAPGSISLAPFLSPQISDTRLTTPIAWNFKIRAQHGSWRVRTT